MCDKVFSVGAVALTTATVAHCGLFPVLTPMVVRVTAQCIAGCFREFLGLSRFSQTGVVGKLSSYGVSVLIASIVTFLLFPVALKTSSILSVTFLDICLSGALHTVICYTLLSIMDKIRNHYPALAPYMSSDPCKSAPDENGRQGKNKSYTEIEIQGRWKDLQKNMMDKVVDREKNYDGPISCESIGHDSSHLCDLCGQVLPGEDNPMKEFVSDDKCGLKSFWNLDEKSKKSIKNLFEESKFDRKGCVDEKLKDVFNDNVNGMLLSIGSLDSERLGIVKSCMVYLRSVIAIVNSNVKKSDEKTTGQEFIKKLEKFESDLEIYFEADAKLYKELLDGMTVLKLV